MNSPLTFYACLIERDRIMRIYLTSDNLHHPQCFLEIRGCHREGNVEKIVIRPIELNRQSMQSEFNAAYNKMPDVFFVVGLDIA